MRVALRMLAAAAAASLLAPGRAMPTPAARMWWRRVDVSGGQTLSVAFAGSESPTEVLLLLHGWPEASWFWRPVVDPLLNGTTGRMLVMPDQRGFNQSTKPADISRYNLTADLVADVVALVKATAPQDVKVDVIGHDWGGPVAWAFTSMHPEMVRTLSILNGPHPSVFFGLLHTDPTQQQKSQYMIEIDSAAASTTMGPKEMAEGFAKESWWDNQTAEEMVDAWSQPGAVDGGLAWYRCNMFGSVLNIKNFSDSVPPAMPGFNVSVPTLVIWAMGDTAFDNEENIAGMAAYVPRLKVVKYAGGTHWVAQDSPGRVGADVNAHIREHE